MPRPHEIAADARALYGPLAVRPAAQEAGDGALWVDPSAQSPLCQVHSGHWVSLAPAGVPVLHGPYVVDYTDLPHDGDTLTLWTPRAGDVVLGLRPDKQSNTVFSNEAGGFVVSQDPDDSSQWWFDGAQSDPGFIGGTTADNWRVLATADPVQLRFLAHGDPDLSAGHVALYALVARAVAP